MGLVKTITESSQKVHNFAIVNFGLEDRHRVLNSFHRVIHNYVGGLHSPFTLGPDNPFPFDKPNDDPNIKLDNIGGPGPGGITYTW